MIVFFNYISLIIVQKTPIVPLATTRLALETVAITRPTSITHLPARQSSGGGTLVIKLASCNNFNN